MALDRTTAKGGARVKFNVLKVDYNTQGAIDLILKYGSRWDWHNGLVCPCSIKPQADELKFRKIACSLCNGTGWTYIYNKEIRAVPSSIRREEQTTTYRVPRPGQLSNIFINLTCEPENKVNIRDRMVFKESVTFRSEGQIYTLEANDTYRMTFPIVELLRVIDDTGRQYDFDNYYPTQRDVDVDSNGNLVWVPGNSRPAVNQPFSVLYSFFPSYIVVTAAHEIRGFVAGKPTPEGVQAYEDLPRLFTAKLEIPDAYLFG